MSLQGFSATKCIAQNKFDENPMVLCSFASKLYQLATNRQTDGRTDRRTDGQARRL